MPMRDDWKTCIIKAKEMGFDGIELFGNDYEKEAKMENDLLRSYAVLARQLGIRLSGHPWMEWADIPLDGLKKKLNQLFEYCVRMEMKEVNIHLAFLTDRDQGLDRIFNVLDECVVFLKNHAMNILFENVPSHGIREIGSELADFDKLFTHYGADDPVMLTIDSGHAHIEGITRSLASLWGNRWRYTHINDNDGIDDLHWMPGEGNMDWDEFAIYADAASYAGPLMMEYALEKVPAALRVMIPLFGEKGLLINFSLNQKEIT
jgi:sugar phosphate isomerase/epimerase